MSTSRLVCFLTVLVGLVQAAPLDIKPINITTPSLVNATTIPVVVVAETRPAIQARNSDDVAAESRANEMADALGLMGSLLAPKIMGPGGAQGQAQQQSIATTMSPFGFQQQGQPQGFNGQQPQQFAQPGFNAFPQQVQQPGQFAQPQPQQPQFIQPINNAFGQPQQQFQDPRIGLVDPRMFQLPQQLLGGAGGGYPGGSGLPLVLPGLNAPLMRADNGQQILPVQQQQMNGGLTGREFPSGNNAGFSAPQPLQAGANFQPATTFNQPQQPAFNGQFVGGQQG